MLRSSPFLLKYSFEYFPERATWQEEAKGPTVRGRCASTGRHCLGRCLASAAARNAAAKNHGPKDLTFLGILPSSSMNSARWSSSLLYLSPDLGSKSRSPVMSSKMMHARLHMSADVEYFAPRSA